MSISLLYLLPTWWPDCPQIGLGNVTAEPFIISDGVLPSCTHGEHHAHATTPSIRPINGLNPDGFGSGFWIGPARSNFRFSPGPRLTCQQYYLSRDTTWAERKLNSPGLGLLAWRSNSDSSYSGFRSGSGVKLLEPISILDQAWIWPWIPICAQVQHYDNLH